MYSNIYDYILYTDSLILRCPWHFCLLLLLFASVHHSFIHSFVHSSIHPSSIRHPDSFIHTSLFILSCSCIKLEWARRRFHSSRPYFHEWVFDDYANNTSLRPQRISCLFIYSHALRTLYLCHDILIMTRMWIFYWILFYVHHFVHSFIHCPTSSTSPCIHKFIQPLISHHAFLLVFIFWIDLALACSFRGQKNAFTFHDGILGVAFSRDTYWSLGMSWQAIRCVIVWFPLSLLSKWSVSSLSSFSSSSSSLPSLQSSPAAPSVSWWCASIINCIMYRWCFETIIHQLHAL